MVLGLQPQERWPGPRSFRAWSGVLVSIQPGLPNVGPEKRREGGTGQGRSYMGPPGPGMNPCLALVSLTTAFVPSAGEAALGTSTLGRRGSGNHLCILGSSRDGETLASLDFPFGEEKSEMWPLLPPHYLQSM